MSNQFLQFKKDAVYYGKVGVKYADFPKLYTAFADNISKGTTQEVEKHGKKIMDNPKNTPKDIYAFIYEVCAWGGNLYFVFPGLSRHNGGEHAAPKRIATAVRQAIEFLRKNEMAEAIKILLPQSGVVKGFGIAYASKTLRMLSPEKAATFDSHLQEAVGRELTPADYAVWCNECKDLADKLNKISAFKNPKRKSGKWFVADVEAVVFDKVRAYNKKL